VSVADNKNLTIYVLKKFTQISASPALGPNSLALRKNMNDALKTSLKSLIHHLNGQSLNNSFNYTLIKNINKDFEPKLAAKIDMALVGVRSDRPVTGTWTYKGAIKHLCSFKSIY
jgi:hypothetical protein